MSDSPCVFEVGLPVVTQVEEMTVLGLNLVHNAFEGWSGEIQVMDNWFVKGFVCQGCGEFEVHS